LNRESAAIGHLEVVEHPCVVGVVFGERELVVAKHRGRGSVLETAYVGGRPCSTPVLAREWRPR